MAIPEKIPFDSEEIVTKLEKFETTVSTLEEQVKRYEEVDVAIKKIEDYIEELAQKQENLERSYDAKLSELQKEKQEIYENSNKLIKDTKSDIGNLKNSLSSNIENLSLELQKRQTNELATHDEKFSKQQQDQKAQFNSDMDEYKNQFEQLRISVLSLLPSASVVGVSASFETTKEIYFKRIDKYSNAFYACIIFMVIIPVVLVLCDAFNFSSWREFFFSAVRLLAIEAPLFWIGQILVKAIQQNRRLYAEYAHKHTSAATFIGLRNELASMKKNGLKCDEEERKLISGFIDAMYINASYTLDKPVSTQSPMEMTFNLLQNCANPDIANKILEKFPLK